MVGKYKQGDVVGNWTATGKTRQGNKTLLYEWKCICGKVSWYPLYRIENRTSHYCKHLNTPTVNALYNSYSRNAVRRGLDFTLTQDQFENVVSTNCFWCGSTPSQKLGQYIYNGVDRLDNNVGYVLGNCVPCCAVCNFMKGQLDPQTFLNKIEAIHVNFKQYKITKETGIQA